MSNEQLFSLSSFITKLENSIWYLGNLFWLFKVSSQIFALFASSYLLVLELLYLFTTFFFVVSWLYLKPRKNSISRSNIDVLKRYQLGSNSNQTERHLDTAQARMVELQEQHMISQEYTLPFPYICQIYHLLNLKHLEQIHSFSLNNLKVINVNHLQPTAVGGVTKFNTTLDSPVNPLRIWRKPVVEVGLTLHTPYTVELSIPVYNNKTIAVIFNALPLSNSDHKLFIDIYSNLAWPKLFLQTLLHFASCLTLFEDLPYLQKLAKINASHLVNLSKVSDHETTWLYRRFIDLYGSSLECA